MGLICPARIRAGMVLFKHLKPALALWLVCFVMNPLAATMPNIQYLNASQLQWSGRVVPQKSTVLLDWPAVAAEMEVSGCEWIEWDVLGQSRWVVELNGVSVQKLVYSDQRQAPRVRLHLPHKSQQNGRLRLVKISENQGQPVQVFGMRLSGCQSVKAPASQRPLIEFLGDSYAVGFGNLAQKPEPPEGVPEEAAIFQLTDVSQGFAYLTAELLNADIQLTASSGTGLVSNYTGINPGREWPVLDQCALVSQALAGECQHPWDRHKNRVPAVTVIALGINDFQGEGTTADPEKFQQAYGQLLKQLRSTGVKKFVLLATTIWPRDTFLKEAIQKIVQAEKEAGFEDVTYFEYEVQKKGLFWHPDAKSHQAVARQLSEILKPMLVEPSHLSEAKPPI